MSFTGVEITELALAALLPVLIVTLTVLWFRRRRRDEIFASITPGELPAMGQQVTRERVGGGRQEWSGPVAVRFTPPDGMAPGVVGTVIDGRADVVDVSATLIDLAVRGYLTLRAVPADPDAPPPPQRGPKKPSPPSDHDWELVRAVPPPSAEPAAFERDLLTAIFSHGEVTSIGELKRRGFDLTMREAQIGLYREVVERGWYARHPRDRNRRLGCIGTPLALLGIAGAVALISQLPQENFTPDFLPLLTAATSAGLLVAAGLLWWGGRGRTPRTAEGSAMRIQALGFREYLTKAEANQIRFEEAADLFSRYLPFAMVFGVADRWAATFGEVARAAQLQGLGDAFFDLTWLDAIYVGGELIDLGAGVVGGIGDLAGVDGLDLFGDIGDTLGSVAGSVGDFAGSAADLLDFGDGCGGCDGCDLP